MTRVLTPVLALFCFLMAFDAFADTGNKQKSSHHQLRVMTQNLYVGADLNRIAQAQQIDPNSVPKVVGEVFQTILDTDFKARAEALAAEIKRKRPDLIGLQEVFRITVEPPSDPSDPGYPPTPLEVHDYLNDLLAALQTYKARYKVAALVTNTNVTLPKGGEGAQPDIVRLIDRDAILVRQGIQISRVTARNFRTNLEQEGQTAWRGFVILDAKVRGRTYRFANTHLEQALPAELAPIQAAQARELIVELRDESLPVIVVGDFNSPPLDVPTDNGILPPYAQFIAAGYVDAWKRDTPGFTCCQEEKLTNETSILETRIDQIFTRNMSGPFDSDTVGDKPSDKTPSGLWPSDHAGVVSRISDAD